MHSPIAYTCKPIRKHCLIYRGLPIADVSLMGVASSRSTTISTKSSSSSSSLVRIPSESSFLARKKVSTCATSSTRDAGASSATGSPSGLGVGLSGGGGGGSKRSARMYGEESFREAVELCAVAQSSYPLIHLVGQVFSDGEELVPCFALPETELTLPVPDTHTNAHTCLRSDACAISSRSDACAVSSRSDTCAVSSRSDTCTTSHALATVPVSTPLQASPDLATPTMPPGVTMASDAASTSEKNESKEAPGGTQDVAMEQAFGDGAPSCIDVGMLALIFHSNE